MLRLRPVLAAAALAVVVSAPAQEEEGSRYFSLQSSQVVAPGSAARVQVQTSGGVRDLEFRLYRVKDAASFWRGLDEENRFGGSPRPRGRPRTLLERYVAWRARTRAAMRDTVRYQFSPQYRASIREFLDRPAKPAPKPVAKGRTYADVPVLNSEQLVRSWRQAIVKKQPWDMLTVETVLADPGLYVLEATDGSRHAYTVLSASNLALITKSFRGKILARAVDAATGAPRPGVAVRFIDSRERRDLGTVTTDAAGLAEFAVENPAEEGVRLIGCDKGHCAVAHSGGWALGLSESRQLTGLVYTDRPVYRPGHTVHYRAIALAPSGDARIEVQNSQGEPVARRNASFSEWGTVAGEVEIPAKAPTGYYSVEVKAGEATIYGGFQVEEYRKPEYEVRVTPATRRIVQGGRQAVTIQARYYYGEPVKGARVKYAIRKSRAWLWFDPEWSDGPPGGDDEGMGYGAEQLEEKEARLDEEGNLNIEVAAAEDENDMRYLVDARVTDAAGREITGIGGFLATRGDFLLQLRPSGFVYKPGDRVRVDLRADDFDGKPAGGFDVAVTLTERIYGKDANRRQPWKSNYSARVNEDGRGSFEFTAPDSGSYEIQAAAKGSRVTGTSYLWVSGGVFWPGSEGNQITIVPDKGSYKAGETARLLIVAGQPGAQLWVTAEARTMLWSKFIVTKNAAETVEVPVTAEWEPNVFIDVSAIRGRQYLRGSKMLKVPAERRRLNVKIATDKPQYLPGETANLELAVTGHDGKPVRGEFSVGVVDEPIYAIQPDTTPDLMQVFHGRQWNQVSTESSLNFYFYGESGRRRMMLAGTRPPGVRGQLKPPAPTQPKVRKLFPDTAFWTAALRTGEDGRARVSFPWPDALTTWRTTARGIASDARVGNSVLRTIVRKNLMLTLATPRFFTENDQVRVPLIVRNYYNSAQSVGLSLDVKGAKLAEPLPKSVETAAQGEAVVPAALVAAGGKEVTLLATARGTPESDALELTVPLKPQGLELRGAHTLTASGSGASFRFAYPESATPGTRTLRLQLTPSIASAIYGGLEYLIDYPYGCTEQTMSALLPNLLVGEAVKTLQLPPPVDPGELRGKVQAGVDRLASFQHPDGGWGWWRGDDSHPFLTAYVTWGLRLARLQGFPVRPDVMARGEQALARQFDRENLTPDTLAWTLHALATAPGGLTKPRLDRAFELRSKMTAFGQAMLGLALLEGRDSRATEIARLLETTAKKDASGTYWTSVHDPMFLYDVEYNHEATAFALRFLSQAKPDSPLLPEAARWLVENRGRGYYWESTKRTALVILGLTKWLEQSGDLKPDYSAVVFLNDRKVVEKTFSPSDALSAKPYTLELPDGSVAGENRIRVELNGKGRLTLAANWAWRTLAVPPSVPENNGLSIRRDYYLLKQERTGGRVTWTPVPLEGAARPGDLIGVRLTVNSASQREYLLVEDPIPSGTEIVLREDLYEITRGRELSRGWWMRREERDDRVSFFPYYLPKGESAYGYLLKVTHAGRFTVPPARIEPMYEPGVVSATQQSLLEVQP